MKLKDRVAIVTAAAGGHRLPWPGVSPRKAPSW